VLTQTFGGGVWGPWALVACPLISFLLMQLLLKCVDLSAGQQDHVRYLRLAKEHFQVMHVEDVSPFHEPVLASPRGH
jgi:hypothetical protein